MYGPDERPDPLAPPEGYGSRLGRLAHLAGETRAVQHERATEVAAVEPDFTTSGDGICTWSAAFTDVRCDRPRDWCLLLGDINEHITPLDLCTVHLPVVARVPRFWCTRCRQDMHLEKVGSYRPVTIVVTSGQVTARTGQTLIPEPGGIAWLDRADWPVGLGQERNKPPEKLF